MTGSTRHSGRRDEDCRKKTRGKDSENLLDIGLRVSYTYRERWRQYENKVTKKNPMPELQSSMATTQRRCAAVSEVQECLLGN